MHEGGALSWREVVDRHHTQLVDDLSVHLDSALQAAASRASADEHARIRSEVEGLNQVLRRMRAADAGQVLQILAGGCASYADRLVVLVFDNHQARVAAGGDIAAQNISFDTALAPAIVSAIESRDPVIALATSGEISSTLADAFGAPSGNRKAYLFPVVSRHTVVAMLVASEGEFAPVGSAQIELLCEAAGMYLETAPPAVKAPPAVHVDTSKTATATARERRVLSPAWEGLSTEDQKLHMQAQRMARLRTAEMRLAHAGELKNGTASGDVYAALRKPIDAARSEFREKFLVKSPTMVDYLHLELLRSLAGDDERLLGASYPGPMQPEPVHV
jgi:hypothetical protein